MRNPPVVSIWLDIPDDCRMSAEYTDDGDIQLTLGSSSEAQTMLFEPVALERFVELATAILMVSMPVDPKAELPRFESPAA